MCTKRQLLQANRVSRFYESNKSMSLSQIIKIIGKFISLCNSFALSRIELIFDKEYSWDNRHQHIPCCYGYSVTMATREKPQELICLKPY